MTQNTLDQRLMAGAIALAKRGLGRTAPNPAVGAIVFRPDVHDPTSGEIIGCGWTQPGGRPHAEPGALAAAGIAARGATLYVTLEPCAHHGRTPPCADAIIAAGIARVVYGIDDPDPRVAGKGLDRLRTAGIAVEQSLLKARARHVTIGHALRVSERRPFVQLKIAVDQAGEIQPGVRSKPVWVTGPTARRHGHMLRAMSDAILVGRGTVDADNPSLDCRLPGLSSQSPQVVVLSASGKVNAGAKLFGCRDRAPALIMVGAEHVERQRKILANEPADVLPVIDVGEQLWIPAVLEALVERGITRLLVEGGPSVWQAFDRAGMVDEIVMFRGKSGAAPFDIIAANQMLSRFVSHSPLELVSRRHVGDDDMVTWRRDRQVPVD